MSRKDQVYRFSGSPTMDLSALKDALHEAVSVRTSRGGFLIYAVDPDDDVLEDGTEKFVSVVRSEDGPVISNRSVVRELIASLVVTEVTDVLCMCTGDVAVEFLDGEGNLLTVIRIDFPDRVEWPHWPGIALLAEPDRLHEWFRVHTEIS